MTHQPTPDCKHRRNWLLARKYFPMQSSIIQTKKRSCIFLSPFSPRCGPRVEQEGYWSWSWPVGRQSIQQPPPEDTRSLCFSPTRAQFAVLKDDAWKIHLCALLSGRAAVLAISGHLPFLQQAQELFWSRDISTLLPASLAEQNYRSLLEQISVWNL